MTFTLPRFQRRAVPAIKAQPLDAAAPVSAPMTDVFVEVVLPQHQALPVIPGWTLRLWPQARLGDATLQAHALSAEAELSSLTSALNAGGITTLGALRRRAA